LKSHKKLNGQTKMKNRKIVIEKMEEEEVSSKSQSGGIKK
jgi:hypothetical protein